jgi:hypothetical protein
MQGFAEFVAEHFESTVDLYCDNPGPGYATARFNVQEVAVTVTFEQMEADSPWRVGFTAERGEPTQVILSAFEILGVRQPDALVLVSKTEQLTRIYETYLHREAAKIEHLGYLLEGPVRAEPYTEFILRRTRPSAWRG